MLSALNMPRSNLKENKDTPPLTIANKIRKLREQIMNYHYYLVFLCGENWNTSREMSDQVKVMNYAETQ